eukprot:CAMPEP_0117767474 /NCGR_PEP_ID=MMETSP0947-20121206/21636_1 /TAXON_ID=44440 /ORGANISM="Chattonella subsalsa, Strain CCMP2191" /LENGTH=577 /DNA_ID=CAMNT_0005591141 /DNA_START=86 /DNA_END=1816 /DNA_ORIENTATION=+
MIQANALGGSVTVTSSAQRLFCAESIEFTNPFAKLVVDMSKSQIQSMGDGGLFTLGLASTLLDWALESNLPRSSIKVALETAATWTEEYLQGNACPAKFKVNWSSMNIIESLVRSTIKPKKVTRLTEEELEYISQLTIEAFLAALDDKEFGQARPIVKIIPFPGMPISASEVLTNTILLDTPMPPLPFLPTGPVSIALFDVSLVAPETEIQMEMVASAGNEWRPADSDASHFDQLTSCLLKLQVGVVGCQKLVSPTLRRKLQQKKICVLSRLSLRHIGAMQNISGARVLSSWQADFDSSALGVLGNMKVLKKNSKDYMCVEAADESLDISAFPSLRELDFLKIRQRKKRMATFLVCSCDTISSDELEVTLQSALKVLAHTLLDPHVLAGGGCWEFFLGEHLHKLTEEVFTSPEKRGFNLQTGDETEWLVKPQKERRIVYEALKGVIDCIYKISLKWLPSSQVKTATGSIFSSFSRLDTGTADRYPQSCTSVLLVEEAISRLQECNKGVNDKECITQEDNCTWPLIDSFYGYDHWMKQEFVVVKANNLTLSQQSQNTSKTFEIVDSDDIEVKSESAQY